MTNNKNIKVVLFDLGDTLIYFDADWHSVQRESSHALWQSLTDQDIAIEKQAFLDIFSTRMLDYYREREYTHIETTSARVLAAALTTLNITNYTDEIIANALDAMYAVSQRYWLLEHDTIQSLSWLQEQGYHIGLISNASDTNDVYALLDKHNLGGYFEQILISSQFGKRKPHPAIFEEALQFFGYVPENYMMVGDKLANDVLGANQIGMNSVWITRRANTVFNQQHAHIKPAFLIKNLDGLIKLLS